MLLMELLPDDRIGWSIRLMLGTGMRTQELLALEPRHIAADGSTIESDYVVTYITHAWGGAAQFAEMAERQKKTVINLRVRSKGQSNG